MGGDQSTFNRCSFFFKCLATEVGLLLLSATAIVETVVYSLFALLSLLVAPCTSKPYRFFAKCVQSSSFTVVWSLTDAVGYNSFFVNVMTHESFARYWAAHGCCLSIPSFYRTEDIGHTLQWAATHNRNPVQNPMIAPVVYRAQLINEGATVLREQYATLSEGDQERFLSVDPEFNTMGMVTAIVRRYVSGDRAGALIPHFFTSETQHGITRLRNGSSAVTLQQVAGHELRGMLVKDCWQLAITLIQQQNEAAQAVQQQNEGRQAIAI